MVLSPSTWQVLLDFPRLERLSLFYAYLTSHALSLVTLSTEPWKYDFTWFSPQLISKYLETVGLDLHLGVCRAYLSVCLGSLHCLQSRLMDRKRKWIDKQLDGQMGGSMDGWMHGWKDGWLSGWLSDWLHRWEFITFPNQELPAVQRTR